MRVLVSILLLFVLIPPLFGGDMPGDYFPDGKFSRFETDEWFGRYLQSMEEPSLFKIANRDPSAQLYRITYFPPYCPFVSLKLEVRADGSGVLEVRKMEQVEMNDDYVPRRLIRRALITVPVQEVIHFQQLLKNLNFWNVATHSPSLGSLSLGGTAFLYEGVNHGKYNILDLQNPEKSDVIAPAQYLFKLAGEKF